MPDAAGLGRAAEREAERARGEFEGRSPDAPSLVEDRQLDPRVAAGQATDNGVAERGDAEIPGVRGGTEEAKVERLRNHAVLREKRRCAAQHGSSGADLGAQSSES